MRRTKTLLALLLMLSPGLAWAQTTTRTFPELYLSLTGGTMTGPILLPDGTAAAPSLAFASAPTTGFHLENSRLTIDIAGVRHISFAGTSAILASTGSYTFSDGTSTAGNRDLFLSRAAAATLQLGAADAAAPVAQTLQAQGVAAGTSDVSGANLTITGGNGRGSAAGSSLIFRTPAPVGSGNGAQTMMDRLQLYSLPSGASVATFGGYVYAPQSLGFWNSGVLTAATMTNELGGSYAKLATNTSSYTWTNAMVVALGAVTSGDITVATLPAKTQLLDAAVVIITPDTSANALTVQCGDTATFINYVVASDAKAAANTFYGDAVAERGTAIDVEHYYLPSYTATTTVTCRFIKAVTNLNTVTGSTGRVILTTRLLP